VTLHTVGRVSVQFPTHSGGFAMTVSSSPIVFVGIDWATQAHEVCVLDGSGRILGQKAFLNNAEGLEALVHWLIELAGGVVKAIAVAIERPDGLVVEALLDYGIAVYTLNPMQLDRFRDRFSVAGAKDDRRDGLVLADSLRTDGRAFHLVVPPPFEVVVLRGSAREDDALRIEESVLNNRLRDLLARYYPQMLDLAADRVAPVLWDLWELAPASEAAASVSRQAIVTQLRRHRIRRLTVEKVMKALTGQAPRVSAATTESSVQVIRRLLPRLRLVHEQRLECGRQIEAQLDALAASCVVKENQHSDVAILRSLPGVGRTVAARVLSEAADAIRHRDLRRLRTLGGSAPVTKQSGKTRQVAMRRACNKWLRYAYYHWGRTAILHDASIMTHYRALRARGKSHGRALRGVVDRLLIVTVAMFRKGTLYDPSQRLPGRSNKTQPGEGRSAHPESKPASNQGISDDLFTICIST
jgi:transposase